MCVRVFVCCGCIAHLVLVVSSYTNFAENMPLSLFKARHEAELRMHMLDLSNRSCGIAGAGGDTQATPASGATSRAAILSFAQPSCKFIS